MMANLEGAGTQESADKTIESDPYDSEAEMAKLEGLGTQTHPNEETDGEMDSGVMMQNLEGNGTPMETQEDGRSRRNNAGRAGRVKSTQLEALERLKAERKASQ